MKKLSSLTASPRRVTSILVLDTTADDVTIVAQVDAGGQTIATRPLRQARTRRSGDRLFQTLEKIIALFSLSGIIVATGQGRFSRVRQGVVVANAIGFSKNIPVVILKAASFDSLVARGMVALKKKKIFTPVIPLYAAPPSITNQKK